MKIMFVDESYSRRSHMVLTGTVIDSDKLIPLEKYLANFKKKHNIENLKDLRTSRELNTEQKLEISRELYDGLELFELKLFAIINGKYSMKFFTSDDNYVGGLTLMIERLYFHLHKTKQKGMIILDSNCKRLTQKVRSEIYDYILKTDKREGKMRNRIFAPIFFCEDELSHMIQLSDLFAAGVQRAVHEMFKEVDSTNDLKYDEDKLIQYSQFLALYWRYFDTYKGKVSGAGIKYWN